MLEPGEHKVVARRLQDLFKEVKSS